LTSKFGVIVHMAVDKILGVLTKSARRAPNHQIEDTFATLEGDRPTPLHYCRSFMNPHATVSRGGGEIYESPSSLTDTSPCWRSYGLEGFEECRNRMC